ncbi:hypothetical protein, partial [Nocardia gipuzkoensis]|uniref:hypothetical protein n=1 Tax=Nocardia gipuzkoensis TaxID=2749991 RepID=UPI0015EEC2E0
MPQTFVIDQAASFTGVAYLEAKPKTVFGKPDEQDRTPDGRLKWDVQLVAGFRDQFGSSQHEVIKVNVASNTDPGAGLLGARAVAVPPGSAHLLGGELHAARDTAGFVICRAVVRVRYHRSVSWSGAPPTTTLS